MDLLLQRHLTAAFINMKPDTIEFIPRLREKKPAGGYVLVEQPPRNPQVVSFIETSAQGGWPRPTVTLDGVERVAEMQIVAAWDAEIEIHDVFAHQGKWWEVIGVFYDNGYEKRVLVSGRG